VGFLTGFRVREILGSCKQTSFRASKLRARFHVGETPHALAPWEIAGAWLRGSEAGATREQDGAANVVRCRL
jgi:hypothetical protein